MPLDFTLINFQPMSAKTNKRCVIPNIYLFKENVRSLVFDYVIILCLHLALLLHRIIVVLHW